MHYGITQTPSLTASDCLVLGLFDDKKLPDFAITLDKKYNGFFTRLLQKLTEEGDLNWQGDIDGRHVLILHCGEAKNYTHKKFTQYLLVIGDFLLKHRIKSTTICLPQLFNYTPDWQIQQMVLQLETMRYQFLDFKSKRKVHVLESVQFYLPNAEEKALNDICLITEGINLTRNLANLPANICTPTYLAEQAQKLATQFNSLTVKIIDREEMRQMGMGALLAVAQGSHEPPKLIEIQYKGNGDAQPIVLIGKGITFDSGGISIKPAIGMEEMKYDMSGAASVLGTLKACALLKLPINVIGLMPCSENMPGGGAVKPGDIVTSLSGQTIEINNTDAEGRLILADTLTYCERFNPQFVIDVATLTGAMLIALGYVYTGLMTSDNELANIILSASQEINDKTWRMPLDEDYQPMMDSAIADMQNSGHDRTAGSITAACFLSRFTQKLRWAHLDIAGTAWISGPNRHATGRPVPLLIQILRQIAHAS